MTIYNSIRYTAQTKLLRSIPSQNLDDLNFAIKCPHKVTHWYEIYSQILNFFRSHNGSWFLRLFELLFYMFQWMQRCSRSFDGIVRSDDLRQQMIPVSPCSDSPSWIRQVIPLFQSLIDCLLDTGLVCRRLLIILTRFQCRGPGRARCFRSFISNLRNLDRRKCTGKHGTLFSTYLHSKPDRAYEGHREPIVYLCHFERPGERTPKWKCRGCSSGNLD